jgi:hypothetical protein
MHSIAELEIPESYVRDHGTRASVALPERQHRRLSIPVRNQGRSLASSDNAQAGLPDLRPTYVPDAWPELNDRARIAPVIARRRFDMVHCALQSL